MVGQGAGLTYFCEHIKITCGVIHTEIKLGTSKVTLLQPKLLVKFQTDSGRKGTEGICWDPHLYQEIQQTRGILQAQKFSLGSNGFKTHIRHLSPGPNIRIINSLRWFENQWDA